MSYAKHLVGFAAGILLQAVVIGSPLTAAENPRGLSDFFLKGHVTIAVTDSGLGGLSVVAEAAERFAKDRVFEKVALVFVNALFSTQGGYNSLKTREEKAAVFDSALRSMRERFRPDLILIACNTLSVVYPQTPFSREAALPMAGIVDSGVALAAKALKANPKALLVLYGTPTTMNEGTHKQKLVDMGFAPERIITQPCPELETYIEKDPLGDETSMLLSAFVSESLSRLNDPSVPLVAGLNCTHYGYAMSSWESAFASQWMSRVTIINPNAAMLGFLFGPGKSGRFKKAEVTVRAVSMVPIAAERKAAIGAWLKKVSPQTAAALEKYELVPDLFEWQKFVTSSGFLR